MTEAASKLKGDIMRWITSGVAILAGVMGFTTVAVAGNRGLSPIVPIVQYTPVIVAQASQAKVQGTERTIGICQPIENKLESKSSAINDISPIGGAYRYLVKTEGQKIDWSLVETAKLTLVEAPAHGILSPYGNTNSFNYVSSDYQYFGSDKATFLVEIGSYKVKVIHHFVLMSDVPGSGENQWGHVRIVFLAG